jgi:methyl-accepting chemotaxis protein
VDAKDASGTYFTKGMLDKRNGETHYQWMNTALGETTPREKYVAFRTNEQWQWLIGAGAYTEELSASAIYIRNMVCLVALMASLFTGALLFFLLRSFLAPLKETAEAAERVALGDLNVELKIACSDEIGLTRKAFNDVTHSFRTTITQISDDAEKLFATAGQLSAVAGRMSAGVEQTASQAATVATAGEEMSATSSDIARNCLSAADRARHSGDLAQEGARVVERTVAAMQRIADKVRSSAGTVTNLGVRSDQIGEIVGTIEDIADQTNLLALNAAIEAARAGEQGRGFAVVADEVRALAERTTRATKEIGEMIKTIQKETRGAVAAMEEGVAEVERGTGEAAKSGEALDAILRQAAEVTDQIGQIAVAAEEQTSTTGEIAGNIGRINEVITESATGARDSAALANDLAMMASGMKALVGRFK